MNTQNQKKILVVEDNTSLNAILVKKLKEENFIVYTAFDGEAGLEIAYDKKPDMILLDLYMPILDGYDFLESLRNDPWGKDVRVIILTNGSMQEQENAKVVLEKNPLSFLVKSSTKLEHLVRYIYQAFKE